MNETLTQLPDRILHEPELDELLTRPSAALVEFVKNLAGPLVVLGAGGKMGPTLAVRAKRAASQANRPLDVIAVSRFGDTGPRRWLEDRDVRTVSVDLLDDGALRRLPDAPTVVYLVGLKFGTAQDPASTWAMNTLVPARVLQCYRQARVVALSTGNVYPLGPVARGGSTETDALTPLGEYANSAVGRERVFEFLSRRDGAAVALIRLFYAVELRYGVLVDIARKVWTGEPIALANGAFNCIWQGDANDMILRAVELTASPPSVWNLCRPEVFSVRTVATRFGELLERPARFTGTEAPTALLGNSARLCHRLGAPTVELETMLRWIAGWVAQGGRDLSRPTHFEVRDGNY